MKLIYSFFCLLASSSLLYAQQTLSSFPTSIEKGDYDDREALFIPAENKTAGLFLSDNNTMHFLMLGSDGQPTMEAKENMPSNFSSLKRAGAGTLGDDYVCYFVQGNKKVFVFKANPTSKSLTYLQLPFNGSSILFVAAGKGYAYIATPSEGLKNEFTVYKYTNLSEPQVIKVKTTEVDFFKAYSINTGKAIEQIAVVPLNETAHFNKTFASTKCYHNADQLMITSDLNDGETKLLTISGSGEVNQRSVKSTVLADKKAIAKSFLFKNVLWQLSIASNQLIINATDIASNTVVYESQKDDAFDTEAYLESSYTFRSGYNRERKSTSKADLIKTFQRADWAGIGVLESNGGKLLLVAGAVSRNNLSDPSIENAEMTQTSSVNMTVIMERSFSDLHLPSYSAYQQSLLSFKKEIWVYNVWALAADASSISKAMPEEVPAVEESLDLYYRDPQNNSAPAVWKQDNNYLFGIYSTKNRNYSIYTISGKKSEFNRR